MRIAIYARKSAFSDKSESVHNQDRTCREYCALHFPGEHIFLNYTDEDKTGANTNRPALQKMMRDVHAGIIDLLIVYQLDRLTRDVRDYCNLSAELNDCGVHFTSVKESVDTSTPIGEALSTLSAVFAQMERKTISNRVYDNMMGLARAGWWTGGNLPCGYTTQRVVENGKPHTLLVPDPEKAEQLVTVFKLFVERGSSFHSFASFALTNDCFDVFGIPSTSQVRRVITSPYGAPANKDLRDYYLSLGANVIGTESDWDGTHGVMRYGVTDQRNGTATNPRESWIVCPGRHEPILPADLWLAAQYQVKSNMFCKQAKYPPVLLKGILRCKCGRMMSPVRSRYKGKVYISYRCTRTGEVGRKSPDCVSACRDYVLDEKVLSVFREIERDPDVIKKYSPAAPTTDHDTLHKKEKEIESLQKKIGNLSSALAINPESTAAKYIIADMESLDSQIQKKQMELAGLQANRLTAAQAEKELFEKQKEIARLVQNLDDLPPEERNKIARSVLRKCVWDGETLFLEF
jgi:DNA invertase Pin-like site-specific DNA recombinase